jgi:phosphoribosyl 1,2-cyclic phosphodiesterase
MRFASLGSGSRGNALVVESGATRLLLDCGFSIRETERRLARLSVAPDSLAHIGGAFKFAHRYGLPVWLTHGTLAALPEGRNGPVDGQKVELIDGHTRYQLGDFDIQPYPVPHDAREPVQYVFSDGSKRLGVLTDAGSLTQHLVGMLDACDALVLECNHDLEMLARSNYPASVQRRISGRLGHLDNAMAASLLTRINVSRLQHLVAAHLSEQNNLPQLAVSALAEVLGCATGWIGVAEQDAGFDWRTIT